MKTGSLFGKKTAVAYTWSKTVAEYFKTKGKLRMKLPAPSTNLNPTEIVLQLLKQRLLALPR